MRIHVEWDTTYRYSSPVHQLHSEICLLPASRSSGQRVLRGTVSTNPVTDPRPFSDVFGNTVHHLDYLRPVSLLNVHVSAEVETTSRPEAAHRLPPLLERLYLQPTPRAPHDDPALVELAERTTDLRGTSVEVAESLATFLRSEFEFRVGATGVGATALDLLRTREGVCQDFAHVMIAVLRHRGVPARYVSGYLAEAGEAATLPASHAWVQVLQDDHWWGFDPANGQPQDDCYVVTAVGRDYDDVPPIRGTYHGRAREEWRTSIRIDAPFVAGTDDTLIVGEGVAG